MTKEEFFKNLKTGIASFEDLCKALVSVPNNIFKKHLQELKLNNKIDRFPQCKDTQGRVIIEIEKGCKKTIFTIESMKDFDFTIKELEKL